jgi:hypothetical protein
MHDHVRCVYIKHSIPFVALAHPTPDPPQGCLFCSYEVRACIPLCLSRRISFYPFVHSTLCALLVVFPTFSFLHGQGTSELRQSSTRRRAVCGEQKVKKHSTAPAYTLPCPATVAATPAPICSQMIRSNQLKSRRSACLYWQVPFSF